MRSVVSNVSSPEPAGVRRLTLDEWADLPEDEEGELVDGILVEEEMGGVAVAPRRGRKPDVPAWFPGHPPLPRHGLVRVPPDLVIEVISLRPRDHRRDRIEKAREYAAFGVRWYWLVDPEARTLEVLERGEDGRYTVALAASEGRIEIVPGCQGLTLDLDDLWAEIDDLADAVEDR